MACTMTSSPTSGDLQIITRIAVFRGLRPETVAHVIAGAAAVMLSPHETLFRHGDPATAFFIVIDGWIKLYRITMSGEETVVNVLTRGGSYAESRALTGARYPATAEAVSDSRVVRIPADHVVRCIRESPDIALAMIATASHHLHDLVQQIEQLKAQSGVQRVAEFLASLVAVESGSCMIDADDLSLRAGRCARTHPRLVRTVERAAPRRRLRLGAGLRRLCRDFRPAAAGLSARLGRADVIGGMWLFGRTTFDSGRVDAPQRALDKCMRTGHCNFLMDLPRRRPKKQHACEFHEEPQSLDHGRRA
jgi:CRP-like cAMP-binding protein